MCDKYDMKPLSPLITELMLSISASDCVYYTLFYTTSYIRLSEPKTILCQTQVFPLHPGTNEDCFHSTIS